MNKEAILQSNCSFLKQYNCTLADKLLIQDNVKVKAAVTIQRYYRAHVARKVYSRLLAEELNKEEEEFFQRELERASESTVWLQRSRLRRKLSEKETVDKNVTRRREQSAICIQRHWRRWRTRSTFVPVDFDPTFVSILEENFPEICDQYSISRPEKLCSSQSLESRVSDGSIGQVCDSGFEDDTRGSSCSLPRPSVAACQEEEDMVVKRDALCRPAAVQMCFVEEASDDGEDLAADLQSLRMKDVLPQNKRLTKSAQSSSETNIASSKLRTDNSTCKRPRSYGGGDRPDMRELKKGWANSAHLMTVQQLLSWRNVMQCNFANVNMELMEHLANRDELQEQQDQLLQKIFALKNINQNGGIKPKSIQEKEPTNFKRRVSSLFGK